MGLPRLWDLTETGPPSKPHPLLHGGHGMPTPWRLRIFIRESDFTAAAFTAAIYLYFLTASWGVQDHLLEGPLKDYQSHPAVHVEYVMAGVMFGFLQGLVNSVTERVWLASRSLGMVVLVRSALFMAGLRSQ